MHQNKHTHTQKSKIAEIDNHSWLPAMTIRIILFDSISFCRPTCCSFFVVVVIPCEFCFRQLCLCCCFLFVLLLLFVFTLFSFWYFVYHSIPLHWFTSYKRAYNIYNNKVSRHLNCHSFTYMQISLQHCLYVCWGDYLATIFLRSSHAQV